MKFWVTKRFAEFFIFSFLLGLVLPVAGALARGNSPESPEALYQKARQVYYPFKNSKAKKSRRDEWIRCIDQFLAVYEKYPHSFSAYKAVYTAATLYEGLYRHSRQSRDLDAALRYYQRVVDGFSGGELSDDALVRQGEIWLNKKEYPRAVRAFKQVLRDYPEGDMTRRVKRLIAEYEPRIKKPRLVQKRDPGKKPAVLLKQVNYTTRPSFAQVVVHTTGPVRFSQSRPTPERVVLNLEQTRVEGLFETVQVDDPILKRIRIRQQGRGGSRLILDTGPIRGLDVVTRREDSGLVIELRRPTRKAVAPPKVLKARTDRKASPPPPAASRNNRKPAPLIVVDAGHGGKDKGARGRSGLLEKNVNLQISKRLKQILEKRYHYRVVMTREDDTFIPLEKRGELANEHNADLFVSVHANAAKRRSAHGIETYFLGIANSEQAQETAARENGRVVYSVTDNQVQQILASMISTTKINNSSRLAIRVQDQLQSTLRKKFSSVKDLGVKEGPFFVLHDTNMPSILVEVGFVTNSREERRLRNPKYINQLALSIAKGIHAFLLDKGPTI